VGAKRNVLDGIGSTDHRAFTEAGLPGFNTVQDYDGYDVRTHHTNQDFYERMDEADLREANLAGADLTHADFTRADLTGAKLAKSDIDGAIFTGAVGVSQIQGLDQARNRDKATFDAP